MAEPTKKATTKKAAAKKAAAAKADPDAAVLAVIAEMPPSDRTIAERLHALIRSSAPDLKPKLWYGQPAYANGAGKVICFFRGAAIDGERYLTFGFSGQATVDDGNVWPTSYAVTALTAADEKRLGALVAKAADPAG